MSDRRQSIRTEILKRLYTAYFSRSHTLIVDELEKAGFERDAIRTELEELSDQDLVRILDSGPNCDLTWRGVVDVEKSGLADPEILAASEAARLAILRRYVDLFEKQGRLSCGSWHTIGEEVVAETGATRDVADGSLTFLYKAGVLESFGGVSSFRITESGLNAYRAWRAKQDLADEFEALSDLDDAPQERGRRFQSAFATLSRLAGWAAEESVGGEGEEIDVLLERDGTYHLVECRWRNSPVEAKEVRDFATKVAARRATGLFASMSGYTAGANEWAVAGGPEAVVLLLGPKDIADLFGQKTSLDDLIAARMKYWIQTRKVAWT